MGTGHKRHVKRYSVFCAYRKREVAKELHPVLQVQRNQKVLPLPPPHHCDVDGMACQLQHRVPQSGVVSASTRGPTRMHAHTRGWNWCTNDRVRTGEAQARCAANVDSANELLGVLQERDAHKGCSKHCSGPSRRPFRSSRAWKPRLLRGCVRVALLQAAGADGALYDKPTQTCSAGARPWGSVRGCHDGPVYGLVVLGYVAHCQSYVGREGQQVDRRR